MSKGPVVEEIKETIEGIPTQIIILTFTNQYFVTISQTDKLGTIVCLHL
jgi:hypothetical protein